MFRELIALVKSLFVYVVLCVSTFLMSRTIVNYATFETNIQFLVFKQDVLPIAIWRISFYVHVFSAVFALMAGFTQFSGLLQRQHAWLHRLVGRLYVANILVINFPAALVMAVYANGGMQGKTAFLLLDTLWFWFTFQAFRCARAGNIPAHRDHMIRSYALTFSAITLRSWKIVLLHTAMRESPHFYVAEAWLGFVPNLLVAEAWIRWRGLRALAAKVQGARKTQGVNENDKAHGVRNDGAEDFHEE